MQNALRNARGKSVGEAMHEAVTVTPDTSIITAANKIVRLLEADLHVFIIDPLYRMTHILEASIFKT